MKTMGNLTAIDADGHVIEKENEIRKYLKEPWNKRFYGASARRPAVGQLHVRPLCNRAHLEQVLGSGTDSALARHHGRASDGNRRLLSHGLRKRRAAAGASVS